LTTSTAGGRLSSGLQWRAIDPDTHLEEIVAPDLAQRRPIMFIQIIKGVDHDFYSEK
jgi:hypothetical protein